MFSDNLGINLPSPTTAMAMIASDMELVCPLGEMYVMK
jgi:hypothetical protein